MRLLNLCRLVAAVVMLASCGKATATAPSPPSVQAPIPAAEACNALTQTATGLAVLNGAPCDPARTPVVRLDRRGVNAVPVGSCSGTIIGKRTILTAAHCLGDAVRSVRISTGGPGEPLFAVDTFAFYPVFTPGLATSHDVGIITVPIDLPRAPVALLTSRAAQVGETAIVAGWGQADNGLEGTLYAGSTRLASVSDRLLQILIAPPSSSICSGDSGGPLLVQDQGSWVVAGITSASTSANCNEGMNSFTSVRHPITLAFILEHGIGVTQR